MNKFERMVVLHAERKELWEEQKKLQDKTVPITIEIEDIKNGILWHEKDFISRKIWENFTDDQREEIEEARKEQDELMKQSATYTLRNSPFDPFYDKWEICDVKKTEDGKIKVQVSCKRREGTISGLVTFLDTYWTVPFTAEEIEG